MGNAACGMLYLTCLRLCMKAHSTRIAECKQTVTNCDFKAQLDARRVLIIPLNLAMVQLLAKIPSVIVIWYSQ